MRPGRAILIVGVTLLVLSAPPLFLMAREVIISRDVTAQYEWVPSPASNIDSALDAMVGGHRVQLLDDEPVTTELRREVEGPVRTLVDGQDYSLPAPARIRPAYSTPNRYHLSVFLGRITDTQAGREYLVVAQRSGSTYRILWVDSDGRVREDAFDYTERCAVPVRAFIARYVTSHPIGYCSNIMQGWPSLLFPILYPFVSGAAGVLLTIAGAILWGRHRNTPEPA